MPWAAQPIVQLTLLWTSVAAAGLAALFLAVECWASRIWARRLPAIATLLLILLAVPIWYLQGSRLGIACALLAGFYLVAWALGLDSVRQRLHRLLTPRALWLLALIGSVTASQLLGSQLLRSVRDVSLPEETEFADSPVVGMQAMTDRGHAITLFHFQLSASPQPLEAAILTAGDYETKAVRLAESNPASNCHGWVFTGGRFGIRNQDVPAILADNGYVATSEPQDGDLALYKSGAGISHSGIVRLMQPKGTILVESKWGPFGVFLHEPAAQPFSGKCTFYRSPRSGHFLKVVRTVGRMSSLAHGTNENAYASTRETPFPR